MTFNERLSKSLQAIADYITDERMSAGYYDYGPPTQVLQNIMETCRLELIEQRKLGVEIAPPELGRQDISWYHALTGRQQATYEDKLDG